METPASEDAGQKMDIKNQLLGQNGTEMSC